MELGCRRRYITSSTLDLLPPYKHNMQCPHICLSNHDWKQKYVMEKLKRDFVNLSRWSFQTCEGEVRPLVAMRNLLVSYFHSSSFLHHHYHNHYMLVSYSHSSSLPSPSLPQSLASSSPVSSIKRSRDVRSKESIWTNWTESKIVSSIHLCLSFRQFLKHPFVSKMCFCLFLFYSSPLWIFLNKIYPVHFLAHSQEMAPF